MKYVIPRDTKENKYTYITHYQNGFQSSTPVDQVFDEEIFKAGVLAIRLVSTENRVMTVLKKIILPIANKA